MPFNALPAIFMTRLFSLFCLLFNLSFYASAQEVYSTDREGAWEFTYNPSASANRANNLIINQLALAHKKITEKTSFIFHYTYNLSLRYGAEGQLEATMMLNPGVSTGDVTMFGFDLSGILVPGTCDLSIGLYNPYGELIYNQTHKGMPLEELNGTNLLASFPDSLWSKGNGLQAQFSLFDFTDQNYQLAVTELNGIMNYKAALSLADTLENRIRKARVRQLSPAAAFGEVVFSNKSIRLLGEANRTRTILLPGNDPGQLSAKYSVVQFRHFELIDHLMKPGSLSPVSGNGYLQVSTAYVATMRNVLQLTQNTDHQSSPFYYRLFSNCLSLSQISSMDRLLNQYSAKKNFKINRNLLSMRILQQLQLFADELVENGRYAEAVDLLASGEKFAGANPSVSLPVSLTQRLNNARSGLTASYTRVVNKALDARLPDLANKYLSEAELYAEKYGIQELEATGLSMLYQQMADQHIAKGTSRLQKTDFSGALAEFDKAYNLHSTKFGVALSSNYFKGQRGAVGGIVENKFLQASTALNNGADTLAAEQIASALAFADNYPEYHPDLALVDSLKTKVADIGYTRNLQAALVAKRNFESDKVVLFMKQAALLARDFKVQYSPVYDSLKVHSVIPHLNKMYSNGRLKLWAGEPEEALSIAREADYLLDIFYLTREKSIVDQRNDLYALAEELLCSQVTGELESLITQIDNQYSNNRFASAEPLIAEARELIFSRSWCGLSTAELNAVLKKHGNSIRWNKMHQASLEQIEQGDYIQGIDLLQQSEALYSHYRLDTLGLMNTGLFELALNSTQMPLLRYSVDYFIARNKPDQALEIMEKIRLTGISATEAGQLQESLARVMAKRDLELSHDPVLKTMLKIYTGGDKWYKRFAEAYQFHLKNQ